MPIYEFYCEKCNLIMDFFSRRVNTETIPNCPHCGGALSKEVSRITIGASQDASDELGDSPFDSDRMQNAVEAFQDKFDAMGNDADPKRSAELMKQFTEASGVAFNKDIREAIDRIASGEDADVVSSELDDMIGNGADTFAPSDRGLGGKVQTLPPRKDTNLYDM